jgi:D-glycero-D-manno-heptose 1,7-bisphosphate phosphatase
MTEADLAAVEMRMREDVTAAGGRIESFLYCRHGWDEGCECRKPRPGMLYQAQRQFDLDLTRTPFIGDDERDGQAAEAAGCPFLLVTDDHPLSDLASELLSGRSILR